MINYGVLQGSPISPLLFLLYMSKLPKFVPIPCRSLFADYFMIYSESSIIQSDIIQSNLQTSMDALTLFNTDHRIILSCTKSVRVLFERRKSNRLKPQDVTYDGQVIPSSTSVKFLGITSALTFRSHFKLKQIKHKNATTFGQRSLWLAYEKTPLFLLSILGITKIINMKNTKKTCQHNTKYKNTKKK